MRLIMLLALLGTLSLAGCVASLGCLDQNGRSVDWWYALKNKTSETLYFIYADIQTLTNTWCAVIKDRLQTAKCEGQ